MYCNDDHTHGGGANNDSWAAFFATDNTNCIGGGEGRQWTRTASGAK